jgi:serine/threonine protein kinase
LQIPLKESENLYFFTMDLLIGKTIDSYRILEVIGRGGMGVVYKALDTALDKQVALKMMDPRLAEDASFLKRFRSEARALARLENPNIVNVYALRETEFGIFIVMEYVSGMTLADKISRSGPLPWRKALPIFRQLLNGLGHAHEAGVLHRDIKPRNILITPENQVKIMDFGLAKILQSSDVTVTQTRAGTLYYMSPEQVKGLSRVDNRSDLYSLGMTFYEVLTGKVPFNRDDPELKILETIVKQKLPPPTQYVPEIPADLSVIIMKSLEKEPDKRYPSAKKMAEALDYFESGQKMVGVDSAATEKTVVSKSTVSLSPISEKKKYLWGGVAIVAVMVILLFSVPQFRNPFFSLFKSSSLSVQGTNPDIKTGQTGSDGLPSGNAENRVPTATGRLKILSTPSGATVYLNGKERGTTPFTQDDLLADNYSVRLEMKGYKKWEEKDVSVVAGSERSINANLKSVSATDLFLQAIPEGAIYVNGVLKSKQGSKRAKIELNAGEYSVEFRHPQYGSKQISLSLKAGQSRQLVCFFENYINIQSLDQSDEFFWGKVIIDGRDVGLETPIDKYPLPPGRHTITVRREGYRAVEGIVSLEVKAGFKETVIPLIFHLVKE